MPQARYGQPPQWTKWSIWTVNADPESGFLYMSILQLFQSTRLWPLLPRAHMWTPRSLVFVDPLGVPMTVMLYRQRLLTGLAGLASWPIIYRPDRESSGE